MERFVLPFNLNPLYAYIIRNITLYIYIGVSGAFKEEKGFVQIIIKNGITDL